MLQHMLQLRMLECFLVLLCSAKASSSQWEGRGKWYQENFSLMYLWDNNTAPVPHSESALNLRARSMQTAKTAPVARTADSASLPQKDF